MLSDYLGHTDREEGLIQGFKNLMECKNDYRRLMLLFGPFHRSFYWWHLFIACVINLPCTFNHYLDMSSL